MSKRKIPGLAESAGRSGFVLFPDGRYIFEIKKHAEKESKNGLSTNHTFTMQCLDALDEKKECVEMVGKTFFYHSNEMHEDHGSYDEWGHIFVDDLKSMFDNSGTPVPKNSDVDLEDLCGHTIGAALKTVDGRNAEGEPQKKNEVSFWFKDPGEAPKKAAPKPAAKGKK